MGMVSIEIQTLIVITIAQLLIFFTFYSAIQSNGMSVDSSLKMSTGD